MSHARTRIVLACIATAVAILAAGGTAAGYYMAVEPSGSITLASSGKLTFGAELKVECNATLRGSVREGPISIAETTAGSISEASFASCSGGSVERALGAPWTLGAESSTGTLPSEATGIVLTIQRFAVSFSTFGGFVNCLYSGTIRARAALSGADYYDVGSLTVLESTRLTLSRGGFGCPTSAPVTGTLALSPETRLTVCAVACKLNDLTVGRFNPARLIEFGLVATSAEIARNIEFENRAPLEVTGIKVSDAAKFAVAGLRARDILPVGFNPLTVTLRTRAERGTPYLGDYFLDAEDRAGNFYRWILIIKGRT